MTKLTSARTFVLFGLFCVACGGSDSESQLPPARASLYFTIAPPEAGIGTCTVPPTLGNVGGPPRSAEADPGTRVVDGEDGARVSCRVARNASANYDFDISASVEKNGTVFTLRDGFTGLPGAGIGAAAITVATAGNQLAPLMDFGCPLNAYDPPFQISEGSIWSEFLCALVSSSTHPGAECSVTGEFVLENCAH